MSEVQGHGDAWTDEPGSGEEGRRRQEVPRIRANQSTLPQRSEIVIIGGGGVGPSIGYHLAARGKTVEDL